MHGGNCRTGALSWPRQWQHSPIGLFEFRPSDIVLFGRESSGVPEQVHEAVDARLRIPMVEGRRSLNLAVSAAMVAGEAIRQLEVL